jgi:hypothetical protein
VAIIAAYFSYEQVQIAKGTSIRQLRAYVHVEHAGWQGLDGKHFFADTYRIINYGQTPAKVIDILGQIEILPYPLPQNYVPDYSRINNFPQTFLVFPNIHDSLAVFGKIPTKNKGIFSPAEIAEITSDDSNVRAFEFMKIIYIDAFGITRHTYSCAYLNPLSIIRDPTGKILTFQMSAYIDFNNFD